MKILLTNDDGIDAPGLAALHQSVAEILGDRVTQLTVLAPDRGRSECSHSVTTTQELTVAEIRPGWFASSGTPVDCVRIAINAMRLEPDFVLSGVNEGANLGVNLMVSGTFAAARESATQGVPALAVSHYRRPDVPKTWDHVPRWFGDTLREYCEVAMDFGRCKITHAAAPLWNVNLPAIDASQTSVPSVNCKVDTQPLERRGTIENNRVSFDLDFHGRPRDPDSDVFHCFGGKLTISRLSPHAHSDE